MFARYKPDDLVRLIEKFPLTDAGLMFVRRAMEDPARSVRGSTRNMVTHFKSAKMQWMIAGESKTVEGDALIDHDFNDDTVMFADQPGSLKVTYEKNGRHREEDIFPDTLVGSRTTGFILYEHKDESFRNSLEVDADPRFHIDYHGNIVSPSAEAAAQLLGMKYVVSEKSERGRTRRQNQAELHTYLTPRAEEIYAPHVSEIQKLLAAMPFMEFGTLAKQCSMGVDLVKFALAWGYARFDVDHRLVSQPQEVLVFRDASALDLYQVAMDQKGRSGILRKYRAEWFREGMPFVALGKAFTVKINGPFDIAAVAYEDGQTQFFSHYELENYYVRHLLTVNDEPARATESLLVQRFRNASTAAIERALRRWRILQQWQAGEPLSDSDRHSISTLYQWQAAVARALRDGLPPIAGLVGRENDRGWHGPHIDVDMSRQVDALIKEAIRKKEDTTTWAMRNRLNNKLTDLGFSEIGQSAFYVRVKKLRDVPSIRASRGDKIAMALEPNYIFFDREDPIRSTSALQEIHIDHTLLSVVLISSISGKPLGRVWITLAIDEFSRRIVAFYLSFYPPSYRSVMMVLMRLVEDYGRTPETIIHDWGSEFGAVDFMRVLETFDIRRYYRPKSRPRFGNVVERVFGTIESELIKNLVGNTKTLLSVRTTSRQVNPALLAGMTMADLNATLTQYIALYDKAQHPAHHRTPREAFEASLSFSGAKVHNQYNFEDVMPHLLMEAKGKPRTVDGSRGILYNYDRFGHPAFARPGFDGTAVRVKPIPDDPSRILAYIDGSWQVCKSKYANETEAIPAVARRALAEELAMEFALRREDRDHFGKRVAQLLDQAAEAAKTNRDYANEKGFKKFLEDLYSTGIGPSIDEIAPSRGSTSQRIDDPISDLLLEAASRGMKDPSIGTLM